MPFHDTPHAALAQYPASRLRRLRASPWVRDLVQEHRLHPSDLILPLFVVEGEGADEPIDSLPGVHRYSIKRAAEMAQQACDLGIKAIALFPCTPHKIKTPRGDEALNPDNLMCRAVHGIKSAVPHIGIITDVALDPYTSHGHDGVLGSDDTILNDESVEILTAQALCQVKAGADIIAPSDMMDGRVKSIRHALEQAGYHDTLILSYAAKYASAFYGPFRDALGSSGVLKGDKKTYQMNPANGAESVHETAQDIAEGADMVMVKPGLPYLDVIRTIKDTFQKPTFGYHVSGEYAMLKAASDRGWLDYETCLMETLISFKRAGCDGILTYGALDAARMMK